MTVRNLPGFRAYDLPVASAPGLSPAGTPDWYSIENKGDKSATIHIYEPIGGWFGMSAAEFARELSDLDVDTIDLRLNSGGGSVFDGVAIHNSLLAHRARVDVTVDGVAASIASVIAMAGDTVTMGAGTRLMIQPVRGCDRPGRRPA
jgi:ATP-dependent protease ClpP protease subunit